MVRKKMTEILTLVVLIFLYAQSFVFAYSYTYPELIQLSQLIGGSLNAEASNEISTKNGSDFAIDQILTAYQNLKRYEATADDLLELKYQMSHWRRTTASFLLDRAAQVTDPKEWTQLLINLQKINIKLSKEEVKTLSSHQPSSNDTPEIKSAWSLLLNLEADPQKQIKIVPIKPSSWPFEKWVKYPEFSEYDFDGQSVHYRGLTLHPGDIFLADLNHAGDGVYTAMCSPRSSFSHFAFLAFLSDPSEKQGHLYPALVEIYELGVRAVPLSIFLSPQFSPYVEIYRYKNVPEGWQNLVNAKALEMVHEVHAYNFYYEEENETYLSCTTVGSCIFRRTGVSPIIQKSSFIGNIGENVRKLGVDRLDLLTPTDYMTSDRLEFVGTVDNNDFVGQVQKEIVLDRLRHLFETKTLDPNNFPLEFKFNRWGINQIRSGSRLGELFMWFEGFSRETFPKGPVDGMAIVELFEAAASKGVDQSKGAIEKIMSAQLFSIHDLESRPNLQSQIDQNISHLARWFKN